MEGSREENGGLGLNCSRRYGWGPADPMILYRLTPDTDSDIFGMKRVRVSSSGGSTTRNVLIWPTPPEIKPYRDHLAISQCSRAFSWCISLQDVGNAGETGKCETIGNNVNCGFKGPVQFHLQAASPAPGFQTK